MNPYDILQIPEDATLDEIEDAYDALFDHYEPQARAGDKTAIQALNTLNEARETLVDPTRRAQLDASLSPAEPEAPPVQKPTTKQPPATSSQRPTPSRNAPATSRQSSAVSRSPTTRGVQARSPYATGARRRGSYVLDEPVRARRSWVSYLPYFVIIAILGFGIAVGISYLGSKGSAASCVPSDLPTGATVASVSGVPIYQRELDVREGIDKSGALSDPLFASFFDTSTITGTRALDALRFDSLDKLINMEVIQQQAKKEGLYPTEDQQKQLIQQAYQSDRQGTETFEQTLCRLQVSEAKYDRTIIENVVYSVIANQHLPKTGTSDSKTTAFINWICTTRQAYDIKIMATFIVTDNPSCTSGLPSDLALPGLDTTPVPDDIPTAVAPVDGSVTPTLTVEPLATAVPTK